MELTAIQQAIEELTKDQQTELTTWILRRNSDRAFRMVCGADAADPPKALSDLRELRGSGGIRPDYDYKSLRLESDP